MLADDTTLHTTGKNVVQIQKTLQLCLDRISVWCNTNHMLINPVKTKSMVITTRQKHQLSDLSLRLSLDGQNIENVTEHRLLGLIVANPDWKHMRKHVKKTKQQKTVSSFSAATYHQHRYQKTLLQRSHNTSHRLCVSNVGWLWRSTLKKLNSLHWRAGKLILPDPSLSAEQKMSAVGILNQPQRLAYNKGIFMHKVLNNNSPIIVTSPTTPTPKITSMYQGQGLIYLKLAYPSLERPSGTPCLTI